MNLAVIEEDKILIEFSREAKGVLSEVIVSSIAETLKQTDTELSELSALAISIGPGSYTGLRVGLSVAKALAWSNRLPLVVVPTFEVLAFQVPEKKSKIAVITQARQGEILGGIYDFSGLIPVQQGEFFVSTVDKLAQLIPAEAVVLRLGENPWLEALKKDLPDRQILINNEITLPKGSSVALLGLEKLRQGQTVDPRNVEPIYLQKAIYRSKAAHEWIPYPPDARS
jgi:tRNA threonylcarbamoyladenosine biosynthesis protein TsaB